MNGHVSATASLAASDNKQQESEEQVNRLMELLAADPMFDAVPREAQPGCAPNVVRFRFTGQGVYGIPPAQVRFNRPLRLLYTKFVGPLRFDR